MIRWQDCIVPVSDARPYVWVAYQSEKPHLPIAVADTANELAQVLGVRKNTIESIASKHRHGKIKRPRFAKVYTGSIGE